VCSTICKPLMEPVDSVVNEVIRQKPQKPKHKTIIVDGGAALLGRPFTVMMAQLRALGFFVVVTVQRTEPYQVNGTDEALFACCFSMSDDLSVVKGLSLYAGQSHFDAKDEVFLPQKTVDMDGIDMSNKYLFCNSTSGKGYLIQIA
jgi:hypothetical protein